MSQPSITELKRMKLEIEAVKLIEFIDHVKISFPIVYKEWRATAENGQTTFKGFQKWIEYAFDIKIFVTMSFMADRAPESEHEVKRIRMMSEANRQRMAYIQYWVVNIHDKRTISMNQISNCLYSDGFNCYWDVLPTIEAEITNEFNIRSYSRFGELKHIRREQLN